MPSVCPECGAETAAKFRPFCSKRCADLDLGRWLKGSYVIPGGASEAAEDAPTFDREPGAGLGDDE